MSEYPSWLSKSDPGVKKSSENDHFTEGSGRGHALQGALSKVKTPGALAGLGLLGLLVVFVCVVAIACCTALVVGGIIFGVLSAGSSGSDDDDAPLTPGVILGGVPLWDAHNDLPWAIRQSYGNDFRLFNLSAGVGNFNTDLPRLREGRLHAQFWSVYVPCDIQGPAAVEALLEQIDTVERLTQWYPEGFSLAKDAKDVRPAMLKGKVASFYGAEGGHAIDCRLSVLRQLYSAGVRYMTLTHGCSTPWCESSTMIPIVPGGLTEFGRDVVREMNRLGMLVDISHVSDTAMNAALDVSAAPVIFSHSSARALCDVARNVPDSVLERLRTNGGACCVNFYALFVSNEAIAEYQNLKADGYNGSRLKTAMLDWIENSRVVTVETVVDHIAHIIEKAGEDHVCLGSDFDGVGDLLPRGLEDVSKYPDLVQAMINRGWSRSRIEKVVSRNLHRVLREAEEVARQLQKTTLPKDGELGCGGSKEKSESKPAPAPQNKGYTPPKKPSPEELERRRKQREEEERWVQVARERNPAPFPKPVYEKTGDAMKDEELYKDFMKKKLEYETWENQMILAGRKLMKEAQEGGAAQPTQNAPDPDMPPADDLPPTPPD